jgi:hypothetical protein
VLQSIKQSVPTRWADKAAELRALAAEQPGISLAQFLSASGLDLDDVYSSGHSWSELQEAAGIALPATGPHEGALRKACGRLLHVDDPERLDVWRRWLGTGEPPDASALSNRERRLLKMLLVQLLDSVADARMSLTDGAELLWRHPRIPAELVELFDVLASRIPHVSIALDELPEVPLTVYARYARLEIQAACSMDAQVNVRTWREGVLYEKALETDVFVFTLDKTKGQFSPTTRYRDYAISRELIHWESQSGTSAASPTGQRYQQHEARGNTILMFARLNADERAFYFLGPATYVSHVGELPMAVTWRLRHLLPGDLFQSFAAAVA